MLHDYADWLCLVFKNIGRRPQIPKELWLLLQFPSQSHELPQHGRKNSEQLSELKHGGFPKLGGTILGGPYNKDYTILGSMLRSPILENYHMIVYASLR